MVVEEELEAMVGEQEFSIELGCGGSGSITI
jgi:hypothetical protein